MYCGWVLKRMSGTILVRMNQWLRSNVRRNSSFSSATFMRVLSKCFNVDPLRNQRVSLEKKHLWQTAVDGAFCRALYWHFPRYLWLGLQPSVDLWPSKCHIAACSYAKRVVRPGKHVVCEDSSTWKRFLWTEWDAHCLEHKHQQTMRRAHQHRRYTRSSSNRRLLLLLLLLWGEDGLALRHHRSFSATSHLWFINASEGSMRLIYK